MLKVGFVVNPVAGMGGAVGLKGTDGEEVLREAVRRGARRPAADRAAEAVRSAGKVGGLRFLTCSGEMGEDAFMAEGVPCEVVCRHADVTSARDTRGAVRAFMAKGADLVVFVGGDGTARDVVAEARDAVPILGVPSGVKMHSAVFLNTPSELGDLLSSFSLTRAVREAEVLDVDEESFRDGAVRAKVFGVALTPDSSEHVQSGKQSYASGTAEDEADEIGQYMADSMEPGVTYIIGPGSTTARIARAMGQLKSLLGVDVYRDRARVLADASEADLLKELETRKDARIVVSPIGAQGFFFGRGNQQISPEVVRRVGVCNIVVVSTPSKLRGTPVLRVDTGDPALDADLRGNLKVVTGYKRKRLLKVA
jgi:predicted polyphosphate/ATP-dependent NAD kinase